MKKFRFRLQRVLDHKETLKTVAQAAFEEAQIRVREAEAEIQKIKDESNSVQELLQRTQASATSAQELADYLSYLRALDERIVAGQDGLLLLRNEASLKQAELTEALREVKVLEKLKEKQQLDWAQELKTQEANALDEIATIRYLRDREES